MPRPSFLREVALILIKAFVVVGVIISLVFGLVLLFDTELGISDGTCNIAVFPIEGEIWPFYALSDVPGYITPDMVEDFITTAEGDTSIEAILYEINSPGGLPAASERIGASIRNSTLPSVGLIGDIGASGGYMIAASTNYLIASPFSMVGSIGVNASYVEQSKQNEDSGLTYVQLIAGEYKDAGDPNKPLSDEERELIQRDLDEAHTRFIDIVSEYRGLTPERTRELADGSTMGGVRAKDVGLVDAVGGRQEAKTALADLLGKDPSDIVFCEYEMPLIPF